jgi:SRSO17 transposase
MGAASEAFIGRAAERFEAYVERLAQALGHADRRAPLRGYLTGLTLPGERKSVEPMAAQLNPARVRQTHQSLHHLVAAAPWDAAAALKAVRAYVLPAIERQGPIRAWIIDDTGIPKKGRHSVGVAHQYCGQLGKQDNCQVAVTLAVASERASLPIAYRLYLPREWAADRARRRKAGVPEEIAFATKPDLALEQLARAVEEGDVPVGVVLADAGYGNDSGFRQGLDALGLEYVVGVQSATSVWPAGDGPRAPRPYRGRGRPPRLVRRDETHRPISARQLAQGLKPASYHTVAWRQGSVGRLHGRFAAVRVRPAQRDYWRARPHEECWLLIEWPRGGAEPSKYWLSNLPASTPLHELVYLAKLRWRIERDFEELKQEFGLNHFEGRSWRGFHHHATLCVAAYGFLVAERRAFSPGAPPAGFRPRGAPAQSAAP